MLKRPRDAIPAHQAAAACFRDAGDKRGEGRTLAYLGGIQHLAGQFEDAEATLLQAIAILRDAGDRDTEALASRFLTHSRAHRG